MSSSDPRELTPEERAAIERRLRDDEGRVRLWRFSLGLPPLGARASSPAPDEGAIVWRDEPEANARIYQHVGCDEPPGGWVVPLDDMPPPVRSEMECARCCKIVPFKAGFAPELEEAMMWANAGIARDLGLAAAA